MSLFFLFFFLVLFFQKNNDFFLYPGTQKGCLQSFIIIHAAIAEPWADLKYGYLPYIIERKKNKKKRKKSLGGEGGVGGGR